MVFFRNHIPNDSDFGVSLHQGKAASSKNDLTLADGAGMSLSI